MNVLTISECAKSPNILSMLRNRGADQVGSLCAAGLSLLFSQLYAENGFSCVAAQFMAGHGHSCSFWDYTVRTHVGLLLWAG